jgi:hypothetical protein
MIITDKKNEVQRSGVKGHSKFQINATGKAFRILSDGLYKDKPRAILRELSCNAYDAQIEAGVDRPFDVHLPTRLEPFFKIRDYGVGLSRNDIETVYQTYFESTKTNSNDVIGCLGLGSKSPFSYTDSFEVISYFNGKKFTYSAYITEDDTPDIALLSETDTDEPNGLEVSFPVKNCDFYSFTSKAADVFKYFDNLPNFTGESVEVKKPEYIFEGTGWGIASYGYYAEAIMGNVAYPIGDFPEKDELDAASRAILNSSIGIRFDIGDLEVTASREGLSYTKATKANIVKRLGEIRKEIEDKINARLDAIDNLWDARLYVWSLVRGEMSSIGKIVEGMTFNWDGNEVKAEKYFSLENTDLDKMTLSRFSFKGHRRNSLTRTISRHGTSKIEISKDTKIFYNDVKTGSYVRCKQVMHEGNAETVYLIHGDVPESAAHAKELAALLGLSEIEPISVIERQKASNGYVRSAADYNPKNARKMLVYERDESKHVSYEASTYWKADKIDFDAGGLFLPINRYKVNGEEVRHIMERLNDIAEIVDIDLNVPIIGVKNSAYEKFAEHEGWIDIRVFVKEQVAAIIESDKELQDKIVATVNLGEYHRSDKMHRLDINPAHKGPYHALLEMRKAIKETIGVEDNINALLAYCNNYNTKIEYSTIIPNFEVRSNEYKAACERVDKAYPLLGCLDFGWSFSSSNLPHIKEYIDMMDKKDLTK